VQDYIRAWRDRQGHDCRWFAKQPSLEATIKAAGMALTEQGKRQSHQRRIPREALRAWTRALLRRKQRISRTKTFSELYELLGETAADMHGIGALVVYDTATRIGAFLRLKPDYVYLHAGTREGARALGLGRGERIRRSHLPAAFRRLSPADI